MGSTYFFELPVDTCNEEDLPKAAARLQAVERRIRVLVAEHNTTNQLVAKLSLEKCGFQVDFVANGIEAVEAVKAAGGFAGALALSDLARDLEKAIVEGHVATADECRELEACLAQYQEALSRTRFAA